MANILSNFKVKNLLEVLGTGTSTIAGSLQLTGALSGVTTASMSGQLTSTLVTGTAPFVVASTTLVSNLNVASLNSQPGSYYLDLANASGNLAVARLNSGTSASASTYWRGDGTWAALSGTGFSWTTISSANVSPAVTNTGYIMETAGVTRTVTLPASATAGFNISVIANAGSVRIVSNGNVIDGVGSGNDLLLADGNTATLVAKATGSLEIAYGGTSAGTLPAGGTINQVLTKNSSTDYDYSWAAAAGGISDGDKGDITVTGGVWTIDAGAVTLAKMANITTASFIGRDTAATGVPEVLSVGTVRTMLSIANVENTALSTWAGTTNITTVGSIAIPTGASCVTQTVGDSSTKVASTAFVQTAREPRIQNVSSTATLTVASDTEEGAVVTALAVAMNIANPTGTPVDQQKIIIRVKNDGSIRALSYGTQFRPMGNALPTTTVVGKTLYMGFIYNVASTTWDLIAVAQEA